MKDDDSTPSSVSTDDGAVAVAEGAKAATREEINEEMERNRARIQELDAKDENDSDEIGELILKNEALEKKLKELTN